MKQKNNVVRQLTFAFGAILLLFGASGKADAMPIFDVVGGQLVGVNNVDVGGTLYNVDFLNGSCATNFSGCDNPAQDFAFQNSVNATAAASALRDQVFVNGSNLFDSVPSLTFGCPDLSIACFFHIPFGLTTDPVVQSIVFRNTNLVANTGTGFSGDAIFTGSPILPTHTFIESPFHTITSVWARFSPAATVPVPEPASMAIFSLGLLGLGYASRRRPRQG